jgi:hypothetical protein
MNGRTPAAVGTCALLKPTPGGPSDNGSLVRVLSSPRFVGRTGELSRLEDGLVAAADAAHAGATSDSCRFDNST